MIYVLVKHRFTGLSLLLINTHLIGDPNKLNIQKLQAEVLVNWANFYKLENRCDGVVIGGDFNAGNESEVYKYMQTKFKSALKEVHGSEPELTFNTDKIHRAIDYLWYSTFDDDI